MEAIVERCCGLDVHQASVMACLLVGAANQRVRRESRKFGTMTRDLNELRDWLKEKGCTHVVMESTGVYWMPVYAALEGHFTLIVGNAQHIKNVPGRKTDRKDSEWLADLGRHGLIRPSFVPPPPLRELRELLRYRRKLVEAKTAERNRLLRLLETANVKLAAVMSDVFGASGQLMLRAILNGQSTPLEIAQLAKAGLRKKIPELTLALDGHLEESHRFVLGMQLDRLEQVEADIAKLEARIHEKLTPYQTHHERLTQIPGVDWVGAATIIAEMGVDMTVFPTAEQAAAWAGVCPGNNESAGKHKGQAARKGNVHLMMVLVQAAVCASRKKGSYLKAKYWRLAARRGKKRAAVAIAHKILVAAYHMLATSSDYKDLGTAYLEHLKPTKNNLVKRLEELGYQVILKPKPSAAVDPANAAGVAAVG